MDIFRRRTANRECPAGVSLSAASGASFRAKEIVVKRLSVILFLGLWTGVAPAAAQPVRKACFPISEFRSWKPLDTRTIYVRDGFDRVLRLDLSNTCSLLASRGSYLFMWTRGSRRVCSPINWNLSVSQPPPDDFPERCFVTKMRLLLPNEADSIPPQYRP
jgi:hypothetical protein